MVVLSVINYNQIYFSSVSKTSQTLSDYIQLEGTASNDTRYCALQYVTGYLEFGNNFLSLNTVVIIIATLGPDERLIIKDKRRGGINIKKIKYSLCNIQYSLCNI